MKLSKRQLKRIIREEYSRLKRRGLIREYMQPGSDEFMALKDLMDEYCSPATIQLIMDSDKGSELKARAFRQENNTMFEIQDIIADMREMFGMDPDVTLDSMAAFDYNILNRILEDSY